MSEKNVFGYLLSGREITSPRRDAPASIHSISEEKKRYNNISQKIQMLLNIAKHVSDINYTGNERSRFADVGRIFYKTVSIKISDMHAFGKQVLLEQAVIACVSNIEGFFSFSFEKIFNDNKFFDRKMIAKGSLINFLQDNRLTDELHRKYFLNGNTFNNLNFGTYIIKGRKISFQQKDVLKSFVKMFPPVKDRIADQFWSELTIFMKERHQLVHRPGNPNPDVCKSQRIEGALEIFDMGIQELEERLFTRYSHHYFQEHLRKG